MTTRFRVADLRRRATPALASWCGVAALLIVGLLAHPALGRQGENVTTTLLLYVTGATAWNLIGGMGGQFSLAQSAFVGVGGYTSVMVMLKLGWSIGPALLAAAVLGLALAGLMGAVLLRLRGPHFTIGSLAFALAALSWMTIWSFTGATTGLSAPLALVPPPATTFTIALVLAVAAVGVSTAIAHSRYGLRLMAVRDDEEVADSLGVTPFATKLVALVLSGVLTALVGATFAMTTISIEPFSAFGVDWTISFVVMAIVGGLGTVWGPALGAVIVYYGLTVQLQQFPTVSSIVSGVLIVALIIFLPNGILGALRRLSGAVISGLASRRRPGARNSADRAAHSPDRGPDAANSAADPAGRTADSADGPVDSPDGTVALVAEQPFELGRR